ncbi:hypothetical protein H7Y21_01995 [Arenimonas sp.]|nr:hypothetical protein [Candidatus Parcubacteria bacterium]
MPSQESNLSQESNIKWAATAERFRIKIDEEVERIGDMDHRVADLNKLESVIHSSFSIYEKQGKSIKEVEDDIKHRQNNAENELDEKIYTQILLFLGGTFEFMI